MKVPRDLAKMLGIMQGLALRQTVALETIARRMGTIEEALLSITDGNDKSLRVNDVGRWNPPTVETIRRSTVKA